MKNFFVKVKNWFVAHKPTKRKLIQLYAALLTNANVKGFFTGKIYTGNTKNFCVPGLNCYSCPGAIGACPLGALQDSLAQSSAKAPAYIFGILILFGLLLGRTICGFLCPFGLVQELLYKIRTPKLRKNRFTRVLSYFKYVILALVIALPIIFAGVPVFCKYICPAGTLGGAVALLANPENESFFGMLGYLFTWKFCVLVAVIVASIFIYRFLCRFICPLGAIYSLFCKISLLGVKLDESKCIHCGICVDQCKMDVKKVGDRECINCGECIAVCPTHALTWKGSQIFVKNTAGLNQPVPAEGEKVALLSLGKANGSATLYTPAGQPSESDAVGAEADGITPEESEEISDKTATAADISEAETADTSAGVNAEENSAEPYGDFSAEPYPAAEAVKLTLGQRIKAAFGRPGFLVGFIAWAVAVAVLLAAWIGYAVTGNKSVLTYGVGDKTPEFILEVYSSESEKTECSTYNISKVTVLNFWYTDCDPCKSELPYFEAVYEEYLDNGIDIDMYAIHSATAIPSNGVQDFLDNTIDKGTGTEESERLYNTYRLTFAQDTEEVNAYEMLGGKYAYPTTVVITAKGYISAFFNGSCPESSLRSAIEEAIKNPIPQAG